VLTIRWSVFTSDVTVTQLPSGKNDVNVNISFEGVRTGVNNGVNNVEN